MRGTKALQDFGEKLRMELPRNLLVYGDFSEVTVHSGRNARKGDPLYTVQVAGEAFSRASPAEVDSANATRHWEPKVHCV